MFTDYFGKKVGADSAYIPLELYQAEKLMKLAVWEVWFDDRAFRPLLEAMQAGKTDVSASVWDAAINGATSGSLGSSFDDVFESLKPLCRNEDGSEGLNLSYRESEGPKRKFYSLVFNKFGRNIGNVDGVAPWTPAEAIKLLEIPAWRNWIEKANKFGPIMKKLENEKCTITEVEWAAVEKEGCRWCQRSPECLS